MKIAIASDHRGYHCKQELTESLVSHGHEVEDLGPEDDRPCDYPDFAVRVAEEVARHRADRGILICGTGIGMSIAANKVAGIRAALCHDEATAEVSRRHNDANVLCIAGDLVSPRTISRMTEVWIDTPFEEGRHARRVQKVLAYEAALEEPASAPPSELQERA